MSRLSDAFYVTTPIYYVNDVPHIGHAYTTILADVLTRFHKLAGHPTYFLTGTDEHGQKVQQAAQKKNMDPQVHCDVYSNRFREAWHGLNIEYDQFIRTTDPKHISYVQQRLTDLWEAGHIYAQDYEGWYSTGEERFFGEKELVNGLDPIGGRPVEKIREKNYFFRMSAFQEKLIAHIEAHPDFILPDFRRNEVMGFLRQPLNDLCISRPKSRLSWGITLPFDSEYVAYVWVDALFNYASAVAGKSFAAGEALWPADYHLMGKDILTTHAVYWPTLLMGVGMPLPKHLLAHGWWMIEGAKMSKTTGNVVDPMALKDKYGVDAFRYFLTREMVVGQDANFSEDAFISRINFDLANDLGNGLSRILKLASTGLQGHLHSAQATTDEDHALTLSASTAPASVIEKVHQLKLSFAIEEALQISRNVNRYLEQNMPWKLAKQGEVGLQRLNTVLWHAAEALRLAFLLLRPVMPEKMNLALKALGLDTTGIDTELKWGVGRYTHPLSESVHLFPRVEVVTKAASQPVAPQDPFAALQLQLGRIESVEPHPNADALYVVKVDLGQEIRTLCAGLRKYFSPEQLLGQKVIVVANLKPAQLRGVESRGMILAADAGQGHLVLAQPESGALGEMARIEGLTGEPKAQITFKEFEKAPLKIVDKVVTYHGKALKIGAGVIHALAPDGTEVK